MSKERTVIEWFVRRWAELDINQLDDEVMLDVAKNILSSPEEAPGSIELDRRTLRADLARARDRLAEVTSARDRLTDDLRSALDDIQRLRVELATTRGELDKSRVHTRTQPTEDLVRNDATVPNATDRGVGPLPTVVRLLVAHQNSVTGLLMRIAHAYCRYARGGPEEGLTDAINGRIRVMCDLSAKIEREAGL